ncbi:MAG: alpha/beta hydrolase [Chloroflexota bacterium]|nr:alpha/beta hydrolase [Chloroflexota bacterium]
MSQPTLLPGIDALTVETPRLRTHLLVSGPEGGAPVVFIHGNVSSGRFWEETLAALPPAYRGLAPDLRGFGDSQTKPVDATRGLRDFADDLHGLLEAIGLDGGRRVHLVGWSTGGGVAMQYAIDHPAAVASITLVAPISPFGFGGTKDAAGTPCWPDYAGSGGGTANPEFVRRLAAGDRGAESPLSPRNVLNAFYFKPPFRAPAEREEVLLSALLSTRTGDGNYPGDLTPSGHWPGVAPGARGVNNALAPKYCDLSGFARIAPRPPVLWVRGADDQVVSDTSAFDLGFLGQVGAVPDWPGLETFPPQPMVAQTRAVLDAYRERGGRFREEVFADCGHSPHVEKPDAFRGLLLTFLEEQGGE